jgi:hypothetical protein
MPYCKVRSRSSISSAAVPTILPFPCLASGLREVGAEMQAVGDLNNAREILEYATVLLREHLAPDHLRVWAAQEKLKAVNGQSSGGNWMEQA